ncbi:MAG: hypothetical protein MZV64_35760 [Ignavibacteriales bacterium]|nr:hypothetical protein [Ignavibacteriales bacterium]
MAVAEYCRNKNLEIRYIRQMDLVNGHFSAVEGGTGERLCSMQQAEAYLKRET